MLLKQTIRPLNFGGSKTSASTTVTLVTNSYWVTSNPVVDGLTIMSPRSSGITAGLTEVTWCANSADVSRMEFFDGVLHSTTTRGGSTFACTSRINCYSPV